jgi:hypothetical protein
MIHTPDAHNTKDWVNVLLKTPLSKEQWEWLLMQEGGMYHIHRSGTAIKFERKADAEWFILKCAT